jgi:triacylglycerol lipase
VSRFPDLPAVEPTAVRFVVRLAAIALAGWMNAAGGQAGEPVAPAANVVLVHGFLDTGKRFDPLVRFLEKEGCHCFAPSLRPNDCRDGLPDLAAKLSAQIDARFGRSAPIILIGYSMGGLVTRCYVEKLANRKRVRGVFLISTPNHGTFWACLSPSKGQRQMSFNSDFLRALNADDSAWAGIPVSSYWTPMDGMIVPPSSSWWRVGDRKGVLCLLHPWMVKNRIVMEDIRRKIKALTATGG